MGEQVYNVINLDGGLDLVDTHYTLQSRPGTCRVLTNFEPSIEGGYRRINGYERFGTAQPSGGANEVVGTYPYADGIVAVSSDGVYFSTDGTTWSQVNRDTYTAQTGTVEVTAVSGEYIQVTGSGTSFTTEYAVDDHIRIDGNIRQIAAITSDTDLTLESEIAGGVVAGTAHYKNGAQTLSGGTIARTSQGHSFFAWLESDGEYGSLVITDSTGNNNAAYFKIEGSGAGRYYYYDDLNATDFAAPLAPKFCATFEQRVFVANRDGQTGTIFWSDRYQNQRFDGASAGSAQVDSPIMAIKPFKDKLIIFCRNSIYQLVNVNDSANIAILPIAYNTGCAASGSVQELGGDLIFLSHDGIRTLTATDKYGDVTLGVISRQIDGYIKEILNSVDGLRITSTTIRYKNQYRLFYTDSSYADGEQLGLVGTYKIGLNGQLSWQWSRLQNIPVASIDSIANSFITNQEEEKIYHGGYDGYVYRHDYGNDFNGSNIYSQMELNEVDYGDIGMKKTLHYVKIFGDIEGATDDIDMYVKYDYEDENTAQPDAYTIVGITGIALYGTAIFGTDTFGGESKFNKRVLVEGSGFSNKFIFTSDGMNSPYSLNSLYIDLRVGAKQ